MQTPRALGAHQVYLGLVLAIALVGPGNPDKGSALCGRAWDEILMRGSMLSRPAALQRPSLDQPLHVAVQASNDCCSVSDDVLTEDSP